MNTDNADCRNVGEFDNMERPGDFYFADREGHKGIMIILPGEVWVHLMINHGAAGGNRVWGWDANETQPTLTPSIHALGHWHGYMTAGRLVSC